MRNLAAGLFFVLLTISTFAQTVTQRVRTGHTVEDIDVMGKQVILLDGYEVFAADQSGFSKILDVRDAGATSHVNGFTWIASEKLFAFMEPTDRSRMLLSDEKGRPRGTRAITYPAGFFPSASEGLTWLPKGTPFPDHLALVVFDDDLHPRIEIMTTDGVVVHEILLGPPLDDNFIGSVDVFDANHLVAVQVPHTLYVFDYTGAVVSGPTRVLEATNVEAVVRTPDGIAVADYYSGRVFALDRNLQRQPGNDSHNAFGVKIRADGIAWNPDTYRYIVTSDTSDVETRSYAGFTLPISLDDPVPAFHPAAHGLVVSRHVTYMSDEHKIVVARRLPAAILIYAQMGKLLEQIDVSAVGGAAPLTSVVYVPSTQEFYVRFAEATPRLRVVSRTGAFVRDVDLSGTGTSGFGVMTGSGNDLVIRTNAGLIRTDLSGVLLATYDMAPLRMPRFAGITAITNGPDAGKFAACDSSNAEIVVFTLP
ncbi:MAG: hypothetical protein ACXWH7_01050 [Thermoanaerobaculia bacterium]